MGKLNEAPDEATRRKMRAVRRAGTSPEIAVRAALTSLSIAFETNLEGKLGSPDIWLTNSDTPIFVHGCFWHRHDGCSKSTVPRKNQEFWLSKFQKNVERDARIVEQLQGLGYIPITVWQCETINEVTLEGILLERISRAQCECPRTRTI